MTRKRYNIAAVITALLLIVAVALTFILGATVENIVTGGGAQSAYAAEIAVDEGYVSNGDVASDYDPTANVPEGYTARAITQTGWNSYIPGKDNTNIYYYLTEDVAVSSYDAVTTLKGILDGNGHTITLSIATGQNPLTSSGGTDQVVGGLFKAIDGGTIKNVRIKVSLFAIGADNVGAIAGIIAGQATNSAKIENVRVDLDYGSTESMDQANNNDRNVTYLYDYNQRGSSAPNYLILGGVVGDIAGNTTIDETTVSVNSNAGNANLSATTVAGFGISGWRQADDADRYYILGGFVGRVNSGLLTMTNVNLEGSGKIYNFNESSASSGGVWGIGAKHRNNYGFAGGFVGEVGGTAGGTLSINGLNYMFKGVLEKTNMNKSNATGAIVGSGGMDTNKTTVMNAYFSSDIKQGDEYIMGDTGAQWYTGGIIYDISAPVYVSSGKLVIPAQQSTVWTEGKDVLYSVTDKNNQVLNVENYTIVVDESQTGSVYLAMDMFENVPFSTNGQQNYGKLYTLNFLTMGSADIADGFTYDKDTNVYSYSKTYDGVNNLKDISVKTAAGDKTGSINVFSGSIANSGAAGEYEFTLNKGLYAAAGLTEVQLTNAEGNYLVDTANGAIYKMNVKDGAKIQISIEKLALEIAFDGAGNITYGDSLATVKTNNPVSIVSVGGVEVSETVQAPDAFTGYEITGYTEMTDAGTEVTLGIANVLMNGNEGSYEFTSGNATAVIAQYQITGALENDRFTNQQIADGATAVFVPSTVLPDELTFVYGYATSADATEWSDTMPTESNRYYVRVTFDNANYNLATNVYTFTVTTVVTVNTTDKVVDGVFTTEYVNTVDKLVQILSGAVDYDAEVKEETDYFEFSIGDAVIEDALNVSETAYTVKATLRSARYEEASVEFSVMIVTQKIYITGETPNASWAALQNKVYDGEDKTSFGLTTADTFDKTYAITYSATEDGEFTTVASVKNAGYYKITATSANANYEIVDSAAGIGEYYVEKSTPKVDFSNIQVTLAYGQAAVTGDTAPTVSGVYDDNAYTFTVVTLTDSGEAYQAAAVNAGGKVVVTTKDFAIGETFAGNYNAPEIISKEVTVDKAAVTVTTVDKNVTYGDELTYAASDFYSAVVGLVGEDEVAAEYTTDYVVKTAAGSVVDVVLNFTFTSGNADNYLINGGEAVVAGLTVDKRQVNGSVVAPEASYDGKPYDSAYIDSEGILEGDVVNCIVQYSIDNVSFVNNAPVDVGTYYVRVAAIDNDNYSLGDIGDSVAFNIVKAAAPVITLTAKDGLVYNGKQWSVNDIVDVSVSGLFEGDESLGNIQPVCYAVNIVDAGEYTVFANLNGLRNYENTEQAIVTVVIAQAPVTVTLKDNSVIYGNELGGNEVYFVGADGMIGGDNFTVTGYGYSEEYVACETQAGTVIEVTIEYTLDNESNYEINGGAPLKAALYVEKRVLQGTVSAEGKTYDGVAYGGATAVWDNLVGEDEIGVTFEYSTDGRNFSTTAPVDAGTYYVRAAEVVANDNYQVNALATATFTIAKATAPVINATAKHVVYSGSIINPADMVEVAVEGLIDGDEALVDSVNAYCGQTILAAGNYRVGLVLNGLKNYNDAVAVMIDVVVSRADREIEATARMGYGYIEITVNERSEVEYSLDNASWQALASNGRIATAVNDTVTVYLRYVQSANYNASGAKAVTANITFDVLEEYVGRNYLNVEVGFDNANEIAGVLAWQANAEGDKSATYEDVVGRLEAKYTELMNSATDTVVAALKAGATMSGYQKLAATVISVSVGGLTLALGACAVGSVIIKKRKGGCDNEK